jgi:hypothetical protein
MTAAAFPSLAWFRALAERLNADPGFRELAHWTTARIGFGVAGHPTAVLTLVGGHVIAVEQGEGLRGSDYALDGPRDGWDVLFEERGCLPLATNQLHGKLRLRGDLVLAAGDMWTLSNIVRRFRTVAGEGAKA